MATCDAKTTAFLIFFIAFFHRIGYTENKRYIKYSEVIQMKAFANIIKILTALAAVAGAIYVVATYGDEIVAWAKKIWASLPCPKCEESAAAEDFVAAEPAAEEVAQEVSTEASVVEEPAAEIVVEENEPVAEDKDFA
jgi:hypothetical protein